MDQPQKPSFLPLVLGVALIAGAVFLSVTSQHKTDQAPVILPPLPTIPDIQPGPCPPDKPCPVPRPRPKPREDVRLNFGVYLEDSQ